jgi:hypothetical protein
MWQRLGRRLFRGSPRRCRELHTRRSRAEGSATGRVSPLRRSSRAGLVLQPRAVPLSRPALPLLRLQSHQGRPPAKRRNLLRHPSSGHSPHSRPNRRVTPPQPTMRRTGQPLTDLHVPRARANDGDLPPRVGLNVPIPVWIVQDPGVMWLKGHQRQVIRWFFDPHDAPANIGQADRFVVTRRRNPSPPI